MEPTVVSGPLGHTQWEPEQPFPLGFQTVDSNSRSELSPNKTGQAGLDFRKGDQDETLQKCVQKPVALEDLIQGDLISLSVPSSPLNISRRNSESSEEPFLLVDLSDELSGLTQDSSSELKAQIVTEEPPREEQAGLPPSQSRETLSPETRDKGLFPDQVTALPITRSIAEQGLSENCYSPDHISEPPQGLGGTVPLLDLEVPDFDSSLCPASPDPAVCADVPNNVSADVSEAEATVIRHIPLKEQRENELLALGPTDEPLPVDEDACIHNDLTSECNSVENMSVFLMEDQNSHVAKTQSNQEEIALDLCLTVEDVHDDSWDVEQQETIKGGNIPCLRAEERLMDQPEDSDHLHQVASFDLSVQDINISSPEAGWTSEQAVEMISHSEVVGNDSLPVVSVVNTRQEDASSLKAVFDALDQDGDGFVRIEEFMEFAAAYGADQVRGACVCAVFLSRRLFIAVHDG
ncbi:hypothetical protein GOODEAATRI_002848 [Goodea atripinnis]|uniref:EF-hand domain-containing protein n=1 Tax=Goodea atripinnis TaxID=208336 RepID=A0ABV0N8S0_9TELE